MPSRADTRGRGLNRSAFSGDAWHNAPNPGCRPTRVCPATRPLTAGSRDPRRTAARREFASQSRQSRTGRESQHPPRARDHRRIDEPAVGQRKGAR